MEVSALIVDMFVVANELDNVGFYKESDIIDNMIVKVAEQKNIQQNAKYKYEDVKSLSTVLTWQAIGSALGWIAKKVGINSLLDYVSIAFEAPAVTLEFWVKELAVYVATLASGGAAPEAGMIALAVAFLAALIMVPFAYRTLKAQWVTHEDISLVDSGTIVGEIWRIASESVGRWWVHRGKSADDISEGSLVYYTHAKDLLNKGDITSLQLALKIFNVLLKDKDDIDQHKRNATEKELEFYSNYGTALQSGKETAEFMINKLNNKSQ